MDILIYILIGYFLYKLTKYKTSTTIRIEKPKLKEIDIRIEQIESQIYFWDGNTNDFISQGNSVDEAIDRCVQRFKHYHGLKFNISKEDVVKYEIKFRQS